MKIKPEPRGYKQTLDDIVVEGKRLTLSRHEVGTWHGTEKADIVYFVGMNGRGVVFTGQKAEQRARQIFNNAKQELTQ